MRNRNGLLNSLPRTIWIVCSLLPAACHSGPQAPGPLGLDNWHYIEVDSTRGTYGDHGQPDWVKYVGLDAADLDGDGWMEIVSGRYLYRNPKGDMREPWERQEFNPPADVFMVMDVDGDALPDVIGMALPDLFWYEATDGSLRNWTAHRIGELVPTRHTNSQGYRRGQVIPGGREELVLATLRGTFCFEIPEDPQRPWKKTRLTPDATDEGIALADIDADGLIDLVAAHEAEYLAWWKNPGDGSADWEIQQIAAKFPHPPDRIEVADFNGDGRLDVAVTEEEWHLQKKETTLNWFEQHADSNGVSWTRHPIITTYSLNSLDAADLDHDGDMDLISGEHKGPDLRLLLFENDGNGNFRLHPLDHGKESHLGTRLFDLDRDGDLDIVSIGWDDYRFLHLWRNDAIHNQIPAQAFPDFAVHTIDQIGGKSGQTALVDVDQDGDLDWIVGESPWETGLQAWWWEFQSADQWIRHDIGQSDSDVGGSAGDVNGDGWPDYWAGAILFINQQDGTFSRHKVGTIFSHDSEFADINGDGRIDGLANLDKYGLFWYEIPQDPTAKWISHPIISAADYKIHGAVSPRATGDLDGDGDTDIVYAGAWIENRDGRGGEWVLHRNIEFGESHVYGIAVKTWVIDLDADGDLDFVQAEADNPDGRVAWFENDGHANWTRHLIKDAGDRQDFHSLVVADFDLDGDFDVFSGGGPLSTPPLRCFIWENTAGQGRNPGSEQWIEHIIAEKPTHEARGGDVDGDGDIDICTKPWSTGNEHIFVENLLIP